MRKLHVLISILLAVILAVSFPISCYASSDDLSSNEIEVSNNESTSETSLLPSKQLFGFDTNNFPDNYRDSSFNNYLVYSFEDLQKVLTEFSNSYENELVDDELKLQYSLAIFAWYYLEYGSTDEGVSNSDYGWSLATLMIDLLLQISGSSAENETAVTLKFLYALVYGELYDPNSDNLSSKNSIWEQDGIVGILVSLNNKIDEYSRRMLLEFGILQNLFYTDVLTGQPFSTFTITDKYGTFSFQVNNDFFTSLLGHLLVSISERLENLISEQQLTNGYLLSLVSTLNTYDNTNSGYESFRAFFENWFQCLSGLQNVDSISSISKYLFTQGDDGAISITDWVQRIWVDNSIFMSDFALFKSDLFDSITSLSGISKYLFTQGDDGAVSIADWAQRIWALLFNLNGNIEKLLLLIGETSYSYDGIVTTDYPAYVFTGVEPHFNSSMVYGMELSITSSNLSPDSEFYGKSVEDAHIVIYSSNPDNIPFPAEMPSSYDFYLHDISHSQNGDYDPYLPYGTSSDVEVWIDVPVSEPYLSQYVNQLRIKGSVKYSGCDWIDVPDVAFNTNPVSGTVINPGYSESYEGTVTEQLTVTGGLLHILERLNNTLSGGTIEIPSLSVDMSGVEDKLDTIIGLLTLAGIKDIVDDILGNFDFPTVSDIASQVESAIQNTFPFCIPALLKQVLGLMQYDAQAPIVTVQVFGASTTLDFGAYGISQFSTVTRWIANIMFTLLLLVNTRRFIYGSNLGGGSSD